MRSRERNKFEALGTVFFCTSTVVGFVEIFKHIPLCEIFIEDISFYQKRGDVRFLAYVIMPNHFHVVAKVNNGRTISGCIGNIKRITSRHMAEWLKDNDRQLLIQLADFARLESARDCRIWKPRFDSLVITKENTLRQKIDYIHNNPVKDGLVKFPDDWPFSSAGYYSGRKDMGVDIDTGWESIGYDDLSSGRGS